MAALNNVIYGDCRSVSSTLTSFLCADKESEDGQENVSENDDTLSLFVGYDPSIFLNQTKANEYLCPICQHVLRDAIDVGCGNKHRFCESCIKTYYDMKYEDGDNNFVYYGVGNEDWGTSNDFDLWNPNKCKPKNLVKCPLCKIKVKSKTFSKLPLLDNTIKTELRVKCVNHDLKCEWNGKLIDLENHQNNECQYELIKCKFCPYESYRKDIDGHVNKFHPQEHTHSIL